MTKQEKAIREFCGQHADWWPSITQVQEMLALAHPKQEPVKDWIASHNEICALLRQAHDALALTSYPPQRTWVGLTDEDIDQGLLRSNHALQTAGAWRDGVEWATKQLKEKNT